MCIIWTSMFCAVYYIDNNNTYTYMYTLNYKNKLFKIFEIQDLKI